MCNGRGWCNCGQCSCFSPYFGTYCELCSGSEVCVQGTCGISGPNGVCTECVVKLLEVFYTNNVTVDELWTEEFVEAVIKNGTLPKESHLIELNEDKAIRLPNSFSEECRNSTCPALIIINQTQVMDYKIQGGAIATSLLFYILIFLLFV